MTNVSNIHILAERNLSSCWIGDALAEPPATDWDISPIFFSDLSDILVLLDITYLFFCVCGNEVGSSAGKVY